MAGEPVTLSAPGRNGASFTHGLLLGCSPLILLFALFVLAIVSSRSGFIDNFGEDDGVDPITFPEIDLTKPLASLLPPAPKVRQDSVYLGEDLSCVPELMLESATKATTEEWRSRKAHVAALALHLNQKEEDGFLKAVLSTRPDLAGVQFTMGADCRTSGDRAKAFKEAADAVH